jgi:hypothetical protein
MLSVRLDTLDMNNSQIVCGLTMYTAWIPRNRWDCPRSATGLLLVDGISIIGVRKGQGVASKGPSLPYLLMRDLSAGAGPKGLKVNDLTMQLKIPTGTVNTRALSALRAVQAVILEAPPNLTGHNPWAALPLGSRASVMYHFSTT